MENTLIIVSHERYDHVNVFIPLGGGDLATHFCHAKAREKTWRIRGRVHLAFTVGAHLCMMYKAWARPFGGHRA
jgi:hypothetical protein